MLVTVAVCKCHLKSTPGAESALSAKGEGQAVYEQVNECKGGVAASDPTYMEVGAGGGAKALKLQENISYSIHLHR